MTESAVTSKIAEPFWQFHIINEYIFSRLRHLAQTRVLCLKN
jgi:hypothetical protein